MKKLSPTQQRVLDALRAAGDGARMVRYKGGFWAVSGATMRGDIPDGWVDIRTIEAMEKRGLLRRLNVWPEGWRDERGLVDGVAV